MIAVFRSTFSNLHGPIALHQSRGLFPSVYQKGHHKNHEFGIGIGEHASPGTLERAGGDHIHHFAFVAEHSAEVVLHVDPAFGPFLEFLFEVFHRCCPIASFWLRDTEFHNEFSAKCGCCQQQYNQQCNQGV